MGLKRVKQLSFCLFSTILLWACSSADVQVNLPRSADKVVGAEQIVFSDNLLRSRVEILEASIRTVDEFRRARVRLRSRESLGFNIEYRFVWFDEHNDPVQVEAYAWYPIKFKAKNIITLESIAPEPRAEKFQLKLRQK